MREELIEALKRLARGHVDAAETIVDLVMPSKVIDPRKVYEAPLVDAPIEVVLVRGDDPELNSRMLASAKKKAK